MSIYFPKGKEMILMVFMFRGDYLTRKIGHEIINLFVADDGNHYVYVNPWGNVAKDKADKIGTILFVRHTNNYQVEIIAKAWGLHKFDGITRSHMKEEGRKGKSEKRTERYIKHLKAIKTEQINACEGIRYNHRSIAEIFNFDIDNPDDKQQILVSFKADGFRRPQKTLVIQYNDTNNVDMGVMPRQTLKAYLKEGDQGYNKLKEIIEEDKNWEDKDNSQCVEIDKNREERFNILNVIGKADDELAFSNWLCYYLKNNTFLNAFAKKVLELDNYFGAKTEVLREEEHIDLLVKDIESKQMLVIENKIKSGINGTQLVDYKNAAQKIADEAGIPKEKIWYYILLPDYSSIKQEDYCGYKEIRYSCVHKFFFRILNDLQYSKMDSNNNDLFIMDQFVKALCRHTSSYPDSLFEDTYRQFIERIAKLNGSEKN